ncbi:hypothetical protein C8Q77DRAFT_1135207 [Trametes polyzona]|nr:hypothetical protein C8Q77DRAFT_1135207 [Trametes polyzona]
MFRCLDRGLLQQFAMTCTSLHVDHVDLSGAFRRQMRTYGKAFCAALSVAASEALQLNNDSGRALRATRLRCICHLPNTFRVRSLRRAQRTRTL